MEDELYLENIDEFVTDQNRIVSPAGRAARGAGGRRRCATPPQEGETPPHLPPAWLPFEGGGVSLRVWGTPSGWAPDPALGLLELGVCVCVCVQVSPPIAPTCGTRVGAQPPLGRRRRKEASAAVAAFPLRAVCSSFRHLWGCMCGARPRLECFLFHRSQRVELVWAFC